MKISHNLSLTMTILFICNSSHPNKKLYKQLVCDFAEFFAHINFSCNFVFTEYFSMLTLELC